MNKKLRILFSAEDFGSLEQNLFFIKFLDKKKLINKKNSIFICNKIFKEKIDKKIFSNFLFINQLKRGEEYKLNRLIKKNKIDFATVGLSLRSNSLDLFITKIMNKEKIKTICFQDFWGYTGNFNNRIFPDYLFVADTYAKKLSKNRIKSKIINTGLPKYINKKSLINFREQKRQSLLIVGQPHFIPGIESFYEFLENYDFSKFDKVFYLPHPLESNFKSLFKKKNFIFIKKNDLSRTLNRSFIIFSAFSTLCYDIVFSANFYKKKISYKIIFLTFKSKLLKYIRNTVGDDKLPLVNNKSIFQLSNFKNSDIEINQILKKKFIVIKNTKKYFMKYHSESFFLKSLKKIV